MCYVFERVGTKPVTNNFPEWILFELEFLLWIGAHQVKVWAGEWRIPSVKSWGWVGRIKKKKTDKAWLFKYVAYLEFIEFSENIDPDPSFCIYTIWSFSLRYKYMWVTCNVAGANWCVQFLLNVLYALVYKRLHGKKRRRTRHLSNVFILIICWTLLGMYWFK